MQKIIERTVNAERVEDIIAVFGSFDENIRRIEESFDVNIVNRGTDLKLPVMKRLLTKRPEHWMACWHLLLRVRILMSSAYVI